MHAATSHYLFLSCKISMCVENVCIFFFIDRPCKPVLKYVSFPLPLTFLQQAHTSSFMIYLARHMMPPPDMFDVITTYPRVRAETVLLSIISKHRDDE